MDDRIDPRHMAHAIQTLRDGGVVAFPTDTLYGLAIDPRLPDAVARLFALKGRNVGHAVPLIACDTAQALLAARFDDASRRVAAAFWPGPLALVLDAAPVVDADVRAADGSVAIRVPAHATARALASGLGFCITATSANRTGHAPTSSADTVRATLGAEVDYILDGGDSPGGPPSTIVDLRQRAPVLVRAGAVDWERVLRSLQ